MSHSHVGRKLRQRSIETPNKHSKKQYLTHIRSLSLALPNLDAIQEVAHEYPDFYRHGFQQKKIH